jgi:hypothetical protein
MNRIEEYRRSAAECVDLAAASVDAREIAILIDLAGAWLQLAARTLSHNDCRSNFQGRDAGMGPRKTLGGI